MTGVPFTRRVLIRAWLVYAIALGAYAIGVVFGRWFGG